MKSMSSKENYLFFSDEETFVNFFVISLYKILHSYSEKYVYFILNEKYSDKNKDNEFIRKNELMFFSILITTLTKRVKSKSFFRKYAKKNIINLNNEILEKYKFVLPEVKVLKILDDEKELIWEKIIKKLQKMKVIDLFYDPNKEKIIWCFIDKQENKKENINK